MVPSDGTYYLAVTYASAPYEVSFEQPAPETVQTINQTSFTGKAQGVTPYFPLKAGPMTVNVQADSTALKAWLYSVDDLGGGPIPPTANPDAYWGELVDITGGSPGLTMSVPVDIPADGTYIFYVYAHGRGSFTWSVGIQ